MFIAHAREKIKYRTVDRALNDCFFCREIFDVVNYSFIFLIIKAIVNSNITDSS